MQFKLDKGERERLSVSEHSIFVCTEIFRFIELPPYLDPNHLLL